MPQIPSSDDSESCIGRNSTGLPSSITWDQNVRHHLGLDRAIRGTDEMRASERLSQDATPW